MKITEILDQLANDQFCETVVTAGLPVVPRGVTLPDDVCAFYEAVGGAVLFRGSDYEIEIVDPKEFVRANPIIVGDECRDDISFNWFIVAKSGEQYVTIDLDSKRSGRCYDSFWDRHGVVGECAIIASTFTELLVRLFNGRGSLWYWLRDDFSPIGDAYDDFVT